MKERTEVGRTCNRWEDKVKRILKKYDMRARTKTMWLRIEKIYNSVVFTGMNIQVP